MAGVLPAACQDTKKLVRFGYIELEEKESHFLEVGTRIKGHEFHYFDSENCGEDFHAAKPESKRGWDCIHGTDTMLAGFPHLYYYGNPEVPKAFLKKCLAYKKQRCSCKQEGQEE